VSGVQHAGRYVRLRPVVEGQRQIEHCRA
jgi:hypothetical protein